MWISVAIMQPSLFPYLGYFQLMHHVDQFVVFDTAQYIRRGWINRNRILLDQKPHTFTLPVRKAPRDKLIADMLLATDSKAVSKLLHTIHVAYREAPHFDSTYAMVESILESTESSLCIRLVDQLQQILTHLNIDTQIKLASEIEEGSVEGAENRILGMCETLGATTYINPWNGQNLYSPKRFHERNIRLGFLEMQVVPYPQTVTEFVSHLSIVDVMMYCSVEEVHRLLSQYRILYAEVNGE